MRIVAGLYGGRRLNVPKDNAIRPTSDKVRGAIFNALVSQGCVEDARVLDCFAGSGALGLEALSRGAQHCTFIDISKHSLALARENAELLGAQGHADFMIKDATKLEPLRTGGEKYDLVFLDPPYRKSMVEPVLSRLADGGWLAPHARIVVECEAELTAQWAGSFSVHGTKTYGDTQVIFLTYQPAQVPE
jgi:16S rRNA (guanine966-N2)-methyltransferase